MLVVDLLHEFELGVWKAVLTHLVRILEAHDPAKVNELDSRCNILISCFRLYSLILHPGFVRYALLERPQYADSTTMSLK